MPPMYTLCCAPPQPGTPTTTATTAHALPELPTPPPLSQGVPPGFICTKVRKKPQRKERGENVCRNGPPRNHPEEMLLDQAQARTPYTPLFWGVIRVAYPKA